MAAVTFDSVWKKFRRGERHDSLRDLVPSMARRLLGRNRPAELAAQEFWAIRDVSFEVQPGEAFGILGPNGAGKSTALKLLTRILKPTRGHCEVRGRVGALIEVAAGFHPDLTGRENIYLQGSIMGMRPAEIRGQLDRIIDFAGVSASIDTPVKRYSSGMNARLGFSIAAHLSPDVLIIDEILSVGDMAFQERCVTRMTEFKRGGATIVFVSHNLQAISQLCDRALFLNRSCVTVGPTDEVISAYVRERVGDDGLSLHGPMTVTSARLHGLERPDEAVSPGRRLTLRVEFAATQPLRDLTFGFLVRRSTDHLLVFDANVSSAQLGLHAIEAGGRVVVDFTFVVHLARGHYLLGAQVQHSPTARVLARVDVASSLTVHEMVTHSGTAYLDLTAVVADATTPTLSAR
jgi:lipopolysaccharide transport system ATP-binding protein